MIPRLLGLGYSSLEVARPIFRAAGLLSTFDVSLEGFRSGFADAIEPLNAHPYALASSDVRNRAAPGTPIASGGDGGT
jgi:hypothetical protein